MLFNIAVEAVYLFPQTRCRWHIHLIRTQQHLAQVTNGTLHSEQEYLALGRLAFIQPGFDHMLVAVSHFHVQLAEKIGQLLLAWLER